MDYRQAQGNPAKHLTGVGFVILVHVVTVYALVTGLGHKLVEVIKAPIETKLIEEVKKAQPDLPPPPPPKLAPPPPPFVPPPEVVIATSQPATNTITQVTSKQPAEVPKGPIRTEAVIDAKRSCAKPEYPPASRRLEESGTVRLRFLIGVDGQVIDSQIEVSSGFERLDNAARDALSRCKFKPGTVDGVPEQSWARLNYAWKLRN